MVSDSFLPSGAIGDTLAPASPNHSETTLSLTASPGLGCSAFGHVGGKQQSPDSGSMSAASSVAGAIPEMRNDTITASPRLDRGFSPLSATGWSSSENTSTPGDTLGAATQKFVPDGHSTLYSRAPAELGRGVALQRSQFSGADNVPSHNPNFGPSNTNVSGTARAESSLHTLTSLGLGLNVQGLHDNSTPPYPGHSGSILPWLPLVNSVPSVGTGPSPLSPPLPPLQRSVSTDATAPQHELLDAIHLLRQQLSFLIQAWMADRERLEPERQQADANLVRLQAAMDNARQQWSNEKDSMEQQLDALRAQVLVLQEENAAFRSAQSAREALDRGPRQAVGQPRNMVEGIAGDSTSSSDPSTSILSPNPSLQSASSRADILSLPPGLDGASRRPHFLSQGSARTSPIGHPVPMQVAALDPRILPQKSPEKDFLASPSPEDKLLTVIDVHEIDPKLEGIPIKANALKRATFSPPRVQLQPSPSTRRLGQSREAMSRRRDSRTRRWSPHNLSIDRGRTPRLNRTTARDQTMQVLAAEESRRLTMHAGHTPNHSLSLLPTMTATGGRSTTEQSRGGTPSAESGVAAQQADDVSARLHTDDPGLNKAPRQPHHNTEGDEAEADTDGHLQPSDDMPLKGPLMLKNLPAQDDLFFEQLNKKLESVSRGQHALPSVLQSEDEDEDAPTGLFEVSDLSEQRSTQVAQTGGDVPHAVQAVGGFDGEDDTEDGQNLEPEVPLKFKSTSNFGKPFGSS
ncbi:hypothetical protein JDV02_010157 [Purpureocillium takamizusanense]|uniref:Uncharacterized protein n=1 Tax=Purpureocillium takamizusanense TaxID=2060973 RepID=A0A9Q8VGZ9_9HYPO|nr:uncharacterized protein JDV02_010157 [Purpureocillium takamizusanense]UNI24409.1 hypothetical protein JDV02_010157 [Purpureocillium takamizusanense]